MIAKLENYKRISITGQSSTVSNERKEPFNAAREMRSNTYGVVGTARTLLYLEYVKRWDVGCCFHCGELYSYRHKCLYKNLRVVICGEKEEELEEETQI